MREGIPQTIVFPDAIWKLINDKAIKSQSSFNDAIRELFMLRPESEYHEDMGPVLWWKVPIDEPPWVGTPNDLGKEVMLVVETYTLINGGTKQVKPYEGAPGQRLNIGGWEPGYYTHWSLLPEVWGPK